MAREDTARTLGTVTAIRRPPPPTLKTAERVERLAQRRQKCLQPEAPGTAKLEEHRAKRRRRAGQRSEQRHQQIRPHAGDKLEKVRQVRQFSGRDR